MNLLFFDCETSGLPDFKSPPGPHQPHIVQIAAVLVDHGIERTMTALVKPEGWTISPEATKVHGITQERAVADGAPIAHVLAQFLSLVADADLVVGHNLQFDILLAASESIRIGGLTDPFVGMQRFCTMGESTWILKLPGTYGRHKWPKLAESYKFFVGQDLTDAHDAMVDVRACMAVYAGILEHRRTEADKAAAERPGPEPLPMPPPAMIATPDAADPEPPAGLHDDAHGRGGKDGED